MKTTNNYFKAYIKVNIGLDIYNLNNQYNKHSLKSIFVLITDSYYDEIWIDNQKDKCLDEINYYVNNQLISIENDLITKTINYFKKKYLIKDYFKIKIIKNIPIQSGLGGASSDSATIIKYLINRYDIHLNQSDYLDIAINLGSDICFFLSNYSVGLVSEFGNKVEPLDLSIPKIKIIHNQYKCSTKQIFEAFDMNQKQILINHNDYEYIIKNWNKLYELEIINNLFSISLEINNDLKKWYLDQKDKKLLMTGSGAFFIKILK